MDPKLNKVLTLNIGRAFEDAPKRCAVGGSPVIKIANVIMGVKVNNSHAFSWMGTAIALDKWASNRMVSAHNNKENFPSLLVYFEDSLFDVSVTAKHISHR
jgi:hypothetical protein